MSDELSPLTEHHLARRLVLARPSVGTVNLARNARWQWYSDFEATPGQVVPPGGGSSASARGPAPGTALHLLVRGDAQVRPGHGLPSPDQSAEPGAVPLPSPGDRPGLWGDRAHPVLPDVLSVLPHAGGAGLGRRMPAHRDAGTPALAALGPAGDRWESAGGEGSSSPSQAAGPTRDRPRCQLGLHPHRRLGVALPPARGEHDGGGPRARGVAHADGHGPRDDPSQSVGQPAARLAWAPPRLAPRRWELRQPAVGR